MFHINARAGQLLVGLFLFFGQRLGFGRLFGHLYVGMNLLDTLIPLVDLGSGFRPRPHQALKEQLEIMHLAFGSMGTENLSLRVDHDLPFEGVGFAFSGVVVSLLFLGLSIVTSVASTTMASIATGSP